ncbi:epithelial membrane protein 1 isoform X1 [Globicephala melas]|uniref:epithelial membrane protein 1 isoform X1 n=2 Tax=Delphinidae TaxID=9726 RepID=UPI00293D9D8C|nr:epithelial membrane protein 1 isoform X1 [Globicephala melas]
MVDRDLQFSLFLWLLFLLSFELSSLPSHQKAKMLVLLASIFVVHIATVIMLFVSTIANAWMVSDVGKISVGLWKNCTSADCSHNLLYGSEDALKAVQAFMILSIIFSVISLVVFVFQLFTMEKGNRFFLSGATMLVCWLCILVGASIYTHHYANNSKDWYPESHHGYSFILTWICFCFSFIIGILYLVLRKK